MEQIEIPIIQIGSSGGFSIPKEILDKLGMKDSAIAIISVGDIR